MQQLELGKYKCQAQSVMRDAFGILYEGIDSSTQKGVYAKEILHPVKKGMSSTGASFDAIQGINNVSIVPPMDNLNIGEKNYVICPKPEGELLHNCLLSVKKDGLKGRHQLLNAIVDLGKLVGTLHSKGIVHGNINPATVVINTGVNPGVHLLCFSPLTAISSDAYIANNDHLAYVSQEQLRGKCTFSSDVYALGMLLYTGFGKSAAFKIGSPYSLAEQIVWGDLLLFTPDMEGLDAMVSEALIPHIETIGAIAARALQRDPKERYSTVTEMYNPLEKISKSISPFELGTYLYQSGNYHLSLAVLREVIPGPEIARAHVMMGRIYGKKMSNYEKGVTNFKRALKYEPDYQSARLALADHYGQYEHYKLAKKILEELLVANPEDFQISTKYADILNQSGNLTGALNIMRKIQSQNPYYLDAYISAVNFSLAGDNIREAERDSRKAVDAIRKVYSKGNLNPVEVAEVYYLMGVILKKNNYGNRAIDYLKKSLDEMPEHSKSNRLLIELYADNGQSDKALKRLLAGLQISPDRQGILENIANFL